MNNTFDPQRWVDFLSELQDINAIELHEGSACWVAELELFYLLRKNSGAAANGTTIVAPRVCPGAARWIQNPGGIAGVTGLSSDFTTDNGDLVLAADRFSVGANASLTNGSTQWMQPGSGVVTSLTDIAPTLPIRACVLTKFAYLFVGDAANVAGQTVQFFGRLNGVPFLIVSGIATTAGVHAAIGDLPTPVVVTPFARLDIALEPSAGLSAALIQIAVSLG